MINNRTLLTVLETMRKFAPIRTGNLRENATNAEFLSPTTISVYVDADKAPYAVYTNEPWLSPKWHGKRNPNQDWVLHGADAIAQKLADELGGKLQ